MSLLRGLAVTGAVLLGLVLQVVAFPGLAWQGVVPNLVLLLVIAAALVRGAEFGAVLGLLAGLLLDLAPPADHVAGRWALALVVVGYLAGRVRQDTRASPVVTVLVVAASSFVGTSLFALSGMLLQDPALSVVDALSVIPVSVVYDVLVTPVVLPLALLMFRRLAPERVAY